MLYECVVPKGNGNHLAFQIWAKKKNKNGEFFKALCFVGWCCEIYNYNQLIAATTTQKQMNQNKIKYQNKNKKQFNTKIETYSSESGSEFLWDFI